MDLSQRAAGARGFGANSSQQGQANGEHQAQTHSWSMNQEFAKLHQRDMLSESESPSKVGTKKGRDVRPGLLSRSVVY